MFPLDDVMRGMGYSWDMGCEGCREEEGVTTQLVSLVNAWTADKPSLELQLATTNEFTLEFIKSK